MDLAKSRQEIDGIDEQITALLTKRMDVAKEVVKYKRANGLQVTDHGREEQVLEHVLKLTRDEYKPNFEKIFNAIMTESKIVQERR